MSGSGLTFAVVLAVYMAALLGIGIAGYRKTRTSEDFLVAGRSIGPWVGGAVLAATQISAGTFVGTAGRDDHAGRGFAWVLAGGWVRWLIFASFLCAQLAAVS